VAKTRHKTLPPEAETQPELEVILESPKPKGWEEIPSNPDFQAIPFTSIDTDQTRKTEFTVPLGRYSLKFGDKEYIVYATSLDEAQSKFPKDVPGIITLLTPLADDLKNKLAAYHEDVSPINLANKRYEEERRRREKENAGKNV
jgi:hypothetical protein